MGTWVKLAACRDLDTEELWNNTALAIRTCGSCPVTKKCFMYASATKQEYGVWGGMRFEQGKPKPLKIRRYRSMKNRVRFTR
jgi:hypothetical protein